MDDKKDLKGDHSDLFGGAFERWEERLNNRPVDTEQQKDGGFKPVEDVEEETPERTPEQNMVTLIHKDPVTGFETHRETISELEYQLRKSRVLLLNHGTIGEQIFYRRFFSKLKKQGDVHGL